MFESGRHEWCTPKVRVENDASRIDHGPQRVTQRLSYLPRDRVRNAGEGKFNRRSIQSRTGNFHAQAGENGTGSISHDGLPFAGNESGQIRAVQQLIDGWKLPVKIGFGSRRHRDDYPIQRP